MSPPATSHVVGVDVGGTNMQFGVLDPERRLVGRASAKTEAAGGFEHVVDRIVAGIDEACASAGIERSIVAGVGVACAGAVDIPRGVVLVAPNLEWRDAPLAAILTERTGLPVVLENDVNGAVWGEHVLGAAAGRGDVLGVWVGTGVGGGLVLGGRIHHGALFTAGEIGQTIILPDGPPGARTVEEMASRSGMIERLRERIGEHPDSALAASFAGDGAPTMSDIAAAWRAGDALTTDVVARGADLLGIAIANWITVLALDRVILGGGVVESLGPEYIARIRAAFEADVFPEECRACVFDTTCLAADAGLYGAAFLAADALRHRR